MLAGERALQVDLAGRLTYRFDTKDGASSGEEPLGRPSMSASAFLGITLEHSDTTEGAPRHRVLPARRSGGSRPTSRLFVRN